MTDFEICPVGEMDAISAQLEKLDRRQNHKSPVYVVEMEKLSAILTTHRATQKETGNETA